MTRAVLARRSGISERYIAQLEAGRGNASVLVLRALAGALGLALADLLGDDRTAPAARVAAEGLLLGLSEADLQSARDLLAAAFGPKPPSGAPRRIALVGLRGAGKSTLGRRLAERRGLAFHELDREVERDTGMELAELFERHGQTGYRRAERAALSRLIGEPAGWVLATGGSIVAEPASYALLLAHCHTIWLRASPEEHMRRVVEQGDLRPMADSRRAMDELKAILQSREELYLRANAVVDTSGKTIDEALRELSALVAG